MKKMIVSVLVGKNELRDIEIDAEMCVGDLISGLFPGVNGCFVYNSQGKPLDPSVTFGDYHIMNGDVLTVRGA